jgi:ethanolamine utilization protein EutN
MKLATVIGTLVSTIKHPAHAGWKLLVCRLERPDGSPEGGILVAADLVQAGVGDRVLLMTDGSSSRTLVGNDMAPIRITVCGIVDSVTTVATRNSKLKSQRQKKRRDGKAV